MLLPMRRSYCILCRYTYQERLIDSYTVYCTVYIQRVPIIHTRYVFLFCLYVENVHPTKDVPGTISITNVELEFANIPSETVPDH